MPPSFSQIASDSTARLRIFFCNERVRERLRNIARERNVDFGLILVKYGLERILYRLSRSAHREAFILKGALLYA
jgi:hypothetical protein